MSAHPPRLRRLLLLLLGFALLAPLAAAAPGSAAPATAPAHREHREHREQNIAQSVLRHLNHERALHQLRPLTMSDALVRSAHWHNLRMARYNELSHQLPGEAYFANRIRKAGYRWEWAGENIAWNSVMNRQGVVRLEQMMYRERPPNDGHRVNILNSHYRNVGVDVYLDSANHKVWLTTDFGRRR